MKLRISLVSTLLVISSSAVASPVYTTTYSTTTSSTVTSTTASTTSTSTSSSLTTSSSTTSTSTTVPSTCPSSQDESGYSVPSLLQFEAAAADDDNRDPDGKAGRYKRCVKECEEQYSDKDDRRGCLSGCHDGMCKKDSCDPNSSAGGGTTSNCCVRCANDHTDTSQWQACLDGCAGMCGAC